MSDDYGLLNPDELWSAEDATGDDTQDPRDVTDQLGLQDARDESDPGPDDEQPTLSQLLEAGGTLYVGDAEYRSLDEALYDFWRTRYDTREEWEESR